MNIQAVIDTLNRELNANIKSEYYTHIEEWRQWWVGFNKNFHRYTEMTDSGRKKERDLYSLKMAKKICEDWASVLLNEKTKITINDAFSSEFLQGEDETGGVFKSINFWSESNALVEKAFYSGSGAFILKLDNLSVSEEGTILKSSDAVIRMEYLPAFSIIPITVKYGQIIEAAFVSEDFVRGKEHVYVEKHLLENGNYVIENTYYKAENNTLTPAGLPDNVAERIDTGSPLPFFTIIKPNKVNPYVNNLGLGCSVYSQAIDCLKGTDLAFNNFCRDFYLGGKKVFYNRELTKTIGVDKNGMPVYATPDDMMQSLFVAVGNEYIDDKKLVHEFNPDLRVSDNKDGIQAQLDYLSFKCGLGTRHYKFSGDGAAYAVTATQYTGERQELKQNASKHGIIIEKALIGIVEAILWVGNNIMGLPVDPDTGIKIEFSDGYIISDEEKRETDRQDVHDRIMQPWEYRVKWYGDGESQAKALTELAVPTFGQRQFPPGEDDV